MGASSAWNCCDGATEAEGCQVSPCHVTETQDFSNMRGFVTSLDKGEGEEGGGRVWAMDCEMVNTTVGSELVRVTLLDHAGNTAYESLVMPPNKILDYNTRSCQQIRSSKYLQNLHNSISIYPTSVDKYFYTDQHFSSTFRDIIFPHITPAMVMQNCL